MARLLFSWCNDGVSELRYYKGIEVKLQYRWSDISADERAVV